MVKRRVKGGLFLIVAASMWFLACSVEGHREEKPVITVGKHKVTPDAFRRDVRRVTSDLEITSQNWPEVRDGVLRKMIDHYLILEYGREKDLTVSDQEVETLIREIQKDYREVDFKEVLLKRLVDLEEWKQGLREQLLVRKIMAKVSEAIPPVTHEEIRSYFDVHAGNFKHPPMVRVRQIMTRTKPEAQGLLRRLQGGEGIEELARIHSVSPEARRGGDLGWIARGQLEERMERTIFSLSPGQFTPVMDSPYGFHIFQVVSKRPEGSRGLPEVRLEIEKMLFSQKEEEYFSGWLEELRGLYPVVVDQQLLEGMEWG